MRYVFYFLYTCGRMRASLREELLQAGELTVVAICVLYYVRQRRALREKLFALPFLSLCRCQW